MSAKSIVVGLLVLASATLYGQPVTDQPRFDVVSIKPNTDDSPITDIEVSPGGALTLTGYSLKDLIKFAWDVRSFQISPGPGWLDSQKYNIAAKPAVPLDIPGPGGVGERQLRLMVQSLLADRFRLQLHTEAKQMVVYFLIVGKSGSRLRKSGDTGDAGSSMRSGTGRLVGTKTEIHALARFLSGLLGEMVLDKTGLSGAYDFRLEWDPNETTQATMSDSRPSIFTAVQEQLGLRLESGKGPVEIQVIDHAEKASAN